MSSGRSAGRRPRSGPAWPRALVLLLVLLLAGVPTAAAALAAAAPTASAETAEHDALDTPLRPPARVVHRADVPQRPAPLPDAAPAGPADRHRPRPATAPRPPYATPLLRTVVLRC
ncbi:hypothetical protein [Streptomyces fuscichromogenes]|uniref:hypothetical protein n=1 Tax=Streptomyces fuscichromogenes TaxID=1324013 RepID=UPI001670009C|nr:hypothetical protein [Streptomyces fuscichromogenes]